jgi:hypothetical protein
MPDTIYRIEPCMMPGAHPVGEQHWDLIVPGKALIACCRTVQDCIRLLPPEHRSAPEDEGGNHERI